MSKVKHIPQGYKDSPLGIIPKEWEVKRLGELCTKIGSGVTPRGGQNVYLSQGRPFLRSQNVANGYLLLDDVVFIDEITHQKQKSTEIELDDVLLNITGASIGRSAVATSEIVGGNVNQHVCIIRLKDKTLSYYICAFLLSYIGQKQIDSYQAGGNREGLNYDQIASFKIFIPSSKEIIQIWNFLSLWDTAIEKQSELIEKLKLRKRALMQQLLTGKKRLPGFSREWKRIKAGDIFMSSSVRGKRSEVLLSATQEQGVIPRDQLEGRVTMPTGNLESFKLVEVGDFVISLRSFQGGIEYSEHRGIVSPAYTVLKPVKEIDKSFYRFYFKSTDFIGHLAIAVIGIRDGKQISYEDFCFVKIPYPRIEEQKAISAILIQAEKEIELAKEKLSNLQSQKRGLMQQLLTGKKRVSI